MSSHDRRAAARRRAWGRGPTILRFEPLEGRQLMAASVVGPTADVLATSFNTIHSANWGDLFHASGTVENLGSATTSAPVPVQIYASTAPILGTAGATTMLLGTASIPAGLTPGASYAFDQIVGLPPTSSAVGTTGQTLYITLWVDPNSAVAEANTFDKAGRGLGVDTSVVTITPHQPADLVGTALNVTPTSMAVPNTLTWGDSFNITEQIQNKGEGGRSAHPSPDRPDAGGRHPRRLQRCDHRQYPGPRDLGVPVDERGSVGDLADPGAGHAQRRQPVYDLGRSGCGFSDPTDLPTSCRSGDRA